MSTRASVPPRVSVLIPSYNHAPYLGAAVDSVLSGPFEDLELIVVDDGSTDDSRDVLEAIDDPRLVCHWQENHGAHAALGRAAERAQGEIVFILNSDDRFASQRIPTLVARLDHDEKAVLACSYLRIVDGDDKPIGTKHAWRDLPPWPPRSGPRLAELGEPELALLETNWVSTTSNVACRRAVLAQVPFLDLRYAHDWDFLLGVCAHGRIALVEEPLVDYRVHGANTIREGADEQRGAMHFEILWVVARHAARMIADASRRFDATDLRRRIDNSLPTFGYPELLHQLLAWRGGGVTVPPSYDRLLDPEHPFRRHAITTLAGTS